MGVAACFEVDDGFDETLAGGRDGVEGRLGEGGGGEEMRAGSVLDRSKAFLFKVTGRCDRSAFDDVTVDVVAVDDIAGLAIADFVDDAVDVGIGGKTGGKVGTMGDSAGEGSEKLVRLEAG